MDKEVHQFQPWEKPTETWAHVSKQDWAAIRSRKYFEDNWKKSDYGRVYPIIDTCMWRELSYSKTMTVVRLWHYRHGKEFSEAEFHDTYIRVGDRNVKDMLRWKIQKYWLGIRQIQFNPKKRDHTKMRVAYYCMNIKETTAREMSEAMQIELKSVRYSVSQLMKSNKLVQSSPGVYRALPSFQWDRVEIVTDDVGQKFVWEDEHPAMFDWAAPNELFENGTKMKVWDYTRDVPAVHTVPEKYDNNQMVVNHQGNLVFHGDPTNFKGLNAAASSVSVDIDYFKLLETLPTK